MGTIKTADFQVNRRWFEHYNPGHQFVTFLDLLTETKLEPLLDENGNIASVDCELDLHHYSWMTVPRLRKLATTFRLPPISIEWQTRHESWKTVIRGDKVMTIIGQPSRAPRKEET